MNWNVLRNSHFRVILLGAIILFVMGRVLFADFINLDDSIHIHRNPHIVDASASGLQKLWQESYRRLYIPFTYTVWFLISLFAKKNIPPGAVPIGEGGIFIPGAFHAANLFTHFLICAFLLYPILRKLSGRPLLSFLGTLVFAIHPVQVEPVAWISGMKDVLSGGLALLAVRFYLERELPHRRALALGAFVLALLSKPSAVMIPFLIAFIGIWFEKRPWKEVAREMGVWALLTAPIIIVTLTAQADNELEFTVPPIALRIFIALDAVWFYLGKVVLPLGLALDYGRGPERVAASPGWYWVVLLAATGLLGAVLYRFRKTKPGLIGALGLFLIPLVPVLGIKPFVFQNISTVADRYLYLSFLGVALFVTEILKTKHRGRLVVNASLVVVVIFSGLSMRQASFWQDSRTVLGRGIQVNPRSWLCYNNLGVVYEADQNWMGALHAYQKSLTVRQHPTIYNNLGAVYMQLKRPKDALLVFQRAAEFKPNDALLLNNMGAAYMEMGEKEKARRAFEQALIQSPDLIQASENLKRITKKKPS